jgi:hypothetical protein
MRLAACLLVVPLLACAAAPAPPSAPAAPRSPEAFPAVPADGFELRMSRSSCFGRCPVYSLVIHADGRVDYQGTNFVAIGGERHGQADTAALAQLRSRLEDPAAIAWGDYLPGTPACGDMATDMPGARIEAYAGGRWRRIRHYHGCSAAPAALQQLENSIDAAAGAAQWVSGRVIE